MAHYHFGAGTLTVKPGGTGTDIIVGTLQEVSLDIQSTTKELRGAYQFAVDIARGPMKVSGKAKHAEVQGALLAAVLNVTSSVANGVTTIALDNQLMGSGTVFGIEWTGTFRSKDATFTLNAVTIPKVSLAMKSEDYLVSDLDFEAFADASAHVLTITVED